MKKLFILTFAFLFASQLYAEIFIYGPGIPTPPITKLAQKYEANTKQKIVLQTGPTNLWLENAKKNADIVFSGSTEMMDGFINLMPNKLDFKNIQVLNIREAGIIVRANNPKKIVKFSDILKPNVKVMVVNGGAQIGLHEDMALKNKERDNLIKLRSNIAFIAPNHKVAMEEWKKDSSYDALITWKPLAKVLGDENAKFISLDNKSILYRALEISVAKDSKQKQEAQQFIDFLKSKEAQAVWVEYGYIAN
ncbi:hypothetical protein CQA53_07670 [Helicobacter didelphidarum]|uniref:Uncharacterized protein n=1 Tax=Helicobacter didelphidarum TaxID=2040648 RepID=A0A3D8IHM3_9HELI|nr:substrate-binding domain-containing protein [Helicobacter didelphidarum]RDU64623.1 hypothetical protein CQA53_07670 [Helicobacter didelphidarum]